MRRSLQAQIKRIRGGSKADSYWDQYCMDIDRTEEIGTTGRAMGLDVGENFFYTTFPRVGRMSVYTNFKIFLIFKFFEKSSLSSYYFFFVSIRI